ncbi:MAG: hypothetical protein Q8S57_11890 [Methanoregula sp.]|nr:hypothetical protein [Methanoregula sp.]
MNEGVGGGEETKHHRDDLYLTSKPALKKPNTGQIPFYLKFAVQLWLNMTSIIPAVLWPCIPGLFLRFSEL